MDKNNPINKKKLFLYTVFFIYLLFGLSLILLINLGVLIKESPRAVVVDNKISEYANNPELFLEASNSLDLAKTFTKNSFVMLNGHVNLLYSDNASLIPGQTNSEAMSYFLLWNAKDKNRADFDNALEFIEEYMIHPETGYLKWRLESNDSAIGDGENIASDADLRAIKALIIAEENWGDKRYSKIIHDLINSLEEASINLGGYFSPYGGFDGQKNWNTEEVWLSYSDFEAFRKIELRQGGAKWAKLNKLMKYATINSQNDLGLYQTEMSSKGIYSNNLDEGLFSLNSLWIMVRSAQSKDLELMNSARKSLEFYKTAFERDRALYASYDADGSPASKSEATWVYALVGRAAIALEDFDFSDIMIKKLIDRQILSSNEEIPKSLIGSFPEDLQNPNEVTQFTMQESILTLQDYLYLQLE